MTKSSLEIIILVNMGTFEGTFKETCANLARVPNQDAKSVPELFLDLIIIINAHFFITTEISYF